MRRGAELLTKFFSNAGYQALQSKGGEKLFPFRVGQTILFVKNTDKLSLTVHPNLKEVAQKFPAGKNVKDYKNSNQDGFPEHTATTGELYGIAVDFENSEAAVRFAGVVEGITSK